MTVIFEQNGREKTLVGTHLLVAAGRRPNTENIGLESAGIEVTDRGYIKVNERLRDHRARRLGNRRSSGKPSVHPRQRGRLPRGP